MHTHLSCNVSEQLMSIFQSYSEGSIGQRLYHFSVYFDSWLFGQNI